ncbi:MAG: helix-turn-helix domain-containing protein [Bacillaceae bacterium]|nr:helix-turn-helix domain-containing protein [Bacillaceae bacterium]
MKKIVELLLHPVRMNIVQALAKRNLTVQELMEWLPDVPQATLYRHLNILKKSQLILIVDEKKVRGAIERTYSLNHESNLSPEELNSVSKEEHLQYLIAFLTNLISKAEDYLEEKNLELEKDGYGYSQVDLYLTDEELLALQQNLSNVIQHFMKNEPDINRKKRTLATIMIPEKKGNNIE